MSRPTAFAIEFNRTENGIDLVITKFNAEGDILRMDRTSEFYGPEAGLFESTEEAVVEEKNQRVLLTQAGLIEQ